MRNYIFIIFCLTVVLSYGQSNTPEPSLNNSNSNNIAIPTVPAAAVFDTVVPDDYRQENKSSSKKMKIDNVKTKSLEDMPLKEAEEKLEVQGNSAAESQSAVQSFSSSKNQSTLNRTQRTPSIQYQQQMDDAVDYLENTAPESFEYHFFSYQAGNYNVDLVSHLNKAEALRPNNSDVQIQKAAYHIVLGEKSSALSYLEKLVVSKRLSDEAINYSEDLFLSAPEKGTLITHGFDDTYGCYYQQLRDNGKSDDVMIVSLDLLQSEKYQLRLKEFGYVLPKRTIIDVTYLTEFCSLNVKKNIAVSMTVPKEYLVGISDKLFVAGLVFEYHEESDYDNFSRNDQLWNEILKKKGLEDVKTDKGRQLSANYLPMLLHLSDVYGQLNESKKKQQIDTIIDNVAVQCNKYEQVKQLKKSY